MANATGTKKAPAADETMLEVTNPSTSTEKPNAPTDKGTPIPASGAK